MVLLFDGDACGGWPIRVAIVVVAVCGIVAMPVFLVFACFAVVGDSNRVKFVCPTVSSHVAGLGHLLTLAASCATAAPLAIWVSILIGGLCVLGEEGYSVK